MDMRTYYLQTIAYRGDIKLNARTLKEARKETLSILKDYLKENHPDYNSVEFTRHLLSLKREAKITRVFDIDDARTYYSWYYIDAYNRQ